MLGRRSELLARKAFSRSALPCWSVLLALLAGAALGSVRWRAPFAAMMLPCGFFSCLLLANVENVEPRYKLECFPRVLIAAALAIAPRAWTAQKTLC